MDGNGSASALQFGAVTLIPDERLVLKDGRPVSFTPKAFDLLAVLAANPGRLLTKEQLMEAVWPDTVVEESNLAYHVFAIRKALGGSSDADPYIETVPKRGYRFIAPVVRVAAEGRTPLPGLEATPAAAAKLQTADLPERAADAERWANGLLARRAGFVRRRWVGLAAVLMLGGIAYAGLGQLRAPPVPVEPVRFQEPVAGRLAETGMFALSPDGRQLVFAAEGSDGILRLWVRAMSTLQPRALPGTEVFAIIPPVIWSPDSRSVAFDPGGVLKTVSLDGGAAQTVCELPGTTAVGGSWNRQGEILLGSAFGGLIRCPAAGGVATIVTTPDRATQTAHLFPSFLSDGRRFIYLSVSRLKPEASGIFVGELGVESHPAGSRLITTGFGAAFVAGVGSGHGAIVFARDGALFAQRFDEQRLEMIGSPVRLADRVGSYLDGAFFSVSSTILVHRPPEPAFQLTWFDREGQERGRLGAPGRFSGLALSPDDTRALVATHAPQSTLDQDLWLFDFERTAAVRRVTFAPTIEVGPVWVTNDRFAFGAGGGQSGVHQQAVGGDLQLLFQSGRPELPTSVTADGRTLLYTTPGNTTGGDVWVRSGEGASASVRPFLQQEHDQGQAQLSPDGRWVAYVSNEAGPNEVFVTKFHADNAATSPIPGESIRISEGGGIAPRWRRGGRELFYLTLDGWVMAIEVDTEREFRPSTARALFKVPGAIPHWGVTQDGARFLFAVPVSPQPPFDIVQDWQATLPNRSRAVWTFPRPLRTD